MSRIITVGVILLSLAAASSVAGDETAPTREWFTPGNRALFEGMKAFDIKADIISSSGKCEPVTIRGIHPTSGDLDAQFLIFVTGKSGVRLINLGGVSDLIEVRMDDTPEGCCVITLITTKAKVVIKCEDASTIKGDPFMVEVLKLIVRDAREVEDRP